MLFWPFVVNNLIRPTALAIWLLLRILVLGIHQKYFWYAVILAAVLVLLRLLRQLPSESPPERPADANSTLVNIAYWRSLFLYTGQNILEQKTLKRQLVHLLTSLCALQQGIPNDFRFHEALEQGTIPLPSTIHAFLFPQEPPGPGGPIRTFLQSIPKAVRKRVRRWTGQEKAEHDQRIEEILHFLETSLEINHDDREHTTTQH